MSKNIGKIIRVDNLPPKMDRFTNVIYQVSVPNTATYIDYAVDENGDVKTPTLDKKIAENDFSKVKTVDGKEPDEQGNINTDKDIYLNDKNTVTTKEQDTNKAKYLTEKNGNSVIFNKNLGYSNQEKVGSAGGSNIIMGIENSFTNPEGGFATLLGYNNQSLANGNYGTMIGINNKTNQGYSTMIGNNNTLDTTTIENNSIIIGDNNILPTNVTGPYIFGSYTNFVKHSENPKVNALFASIGNLNTHHTGFTYNIGHNLISRAQGEVALGVCNTDYTPTNYTKTNPNTMDRVLSVGAGYYHGNGAVVRRDVFTVHQNGLVVANSLSNEVIETASSKALITKEYLNFKNIFDILASATEEQKEQLKTLLS